MILNYLPYIFGLTSLIGGIYTFLISFKIYRPKFKTEEKKLKFEELIKKFGTLMKICSVILILNGSYDLIKHDPDRYRVTSKNINNEWTKEDREQLLSYTLKATEKNLIIYPTLTRKYCECSVEKIISTMTKEQYLKLSKRPQNEQNNYMINLVKDCRNLFKNQIDSIEKTKNKQTNAL
jgi:hypothetical protein